MIRRVNRINRESGMVMAEAAISFPVFLAILFLCLDLVMVGAEMALLQSVADDATFCGASADVGPGDNRFIRGAMLGTVRSDPHKFNASRCLDDFGTEAASTDAPQGFLGYTLFLGQKRKVLKDGRWWQLSVNNITLPGGSNCTYRNIPDGSPQFTGNAANLTVPDNGACAGRPGDFVTYNLQLRREWFGRKVYAVLNRLVNPYEPEDNPIPPVQLQAQGLAFVEVPYEN